MSGLPDFSYLTQNTPPPGGGGKLPHIMYTQLPQNIPYGRKIFQVDMKCINIIHSKVHNNIPKFGIFAGK
jgi:hypothetical protein